MELPPFAHRYKGDLFYGQSFINPVSDRKITINSLRIAYDRGSIKIIVGYFDSIFGSVEDKTYLEVVTMLGNGYEEVKE